MRRQCRDLILQAADEAGIDTCELRGGGIDTRRDAFQPILEIPDRKIVGIAGRRDLIGQVGETRIDRVHEAVLVESVGGIRVDPRGYLFQAALQIMEYHVALLDRVVLASFDHRGEHVEALMHLAQDHLALGDGRLLDLFGDGEDLMGKPLDRLFGQMTLRRDLVDAQRQRVDVLDHLGGGPVLDDLVDLLGERRNARFDALERLGIEHRHICGGRGDDGARDFVKTLLDQAEASPVPDAPAAG